MTQASKEPGDLGVLGLYRGTPISYEFPLPSCLNLGGIEEGLLEERIFRILKKLFLFFLLGKLNFW